MGEQQKRPDEELAMNLNVAIGIGFAIFLFLVYLAFWAFSNAGFVAFVSFHAAIIIIALLVQGQWRAGLGVLGGAVAVLFLYFLITETASTFFSLLVFLKVCCTLLLFAGFISGLVSKDWGFFKIMLRALAALFLLYSFFEDRTGFYLILFIWCAVEFFPGMVGLSKKVWTKIKLQESWKWRKSDCAK